VLLSIVITCKVVISKVIVSIVVVSILDTVAHMERAPVKIRKMFFDIETSVNVQNFFPWSLMRQENKLDRLSLTCFFGLV
jgi:hypothetical protein